jgi:two-component system, cell cycle sensor histidine kinase and response regulator CckA
MKYSEISEEQLFRTSFEQSPACMGRAGLDGVILEANLAFCRWLGYERNELVGKNTRDITHLGDLNATVTKLGEMGAPGGARFTMEKRYLRKDGHAVWACLQGATVLDDDGSPQYIEFVIQDITDRKLVEEELRNSEKKSRTCLEYSPVCTKIVDLDLKLQYMSRAGTSSLQIADVSLLYGKPYPLDFYPESFKTPMTANLKRSIETGDVVTQEAPVVDVEGNDVWFHSTIVPVTSDDGSAEYLVVVSADITERKQSEATFDAVIKSTAESTGNRLFANVTEGLCDLLGADCALVSEFVEGNEARTLAMQLDGKEVPEHRYALEVTPCAEVVDKGFCFYSDGAAKLFPEDKVLGELAAEGYVGTSLRSTNGNVVGVLCAMSRNRLALPPRAREILEIMALRATGEIERRRSEKDAADIKERLFQAQKMESLGQLAGGLAHDINNMLTAITGISSLMLDELDQQHALYADVKTILESCNRGHDLTRNLLGFARGGKYIPRRIRLDRVIDNTEQLIRRTFVKGIVLRKQVALDLHPIHADAGQISHALLNVCLNAADAMGERGILTVACKNVEVEAEQPEAGTSLVMGSYVQLSVTDTGHGMDQKTLARVFEPFFTTKPQDKGSGLGLSMVYGTINNHGGDVRIASEEGRGTTVKILLPAAQPPASDAPILTNPEPTVRKTGTVLLVDDERTVLKVGTRILQRIGYDTITAENGEAALKLYRQRGEDISFVILDLAMPVMDGTETFRRLHELDPKVLVLISSGYFKDTRVEQLLERGAIGFVQKPYTRNSIEVEIDKALKRSN